MKKRLKGSYTVEAAVMISLCFILFAAAVGVTYKVYKNSVTYVTSREDGFDSVKLFRIRETVSDILDIEGESDGN